jgi:hypothetical protein
MTLKKKFPKHKSAKLKARALGEDIGGHVLEKVVSSALESFDSLFTNDDTECDDTDCDDTED